MSDLFWALPSFTWPPQRRKNRIDCLSWLPRKIHIDSVDCQMRHTASESRQKTAPSLYVGFEWASAILHKPAQAQACETTFACACDSFFLHHSSSATWLKIDYTTCFSSDAVLVTRLATCSTNQKYKAAVSLRSSIQRFMQDVWRNENKIEFTIFMFLYVRTYTVLMLTYAYLVARVKLIRWIELYLNLIWW